MNGKKRDTALFPSWFKKVPSFRFRFVALTDSSGPPLHSMAKSVGATRGKMWIPCARMCRRRWTRNEPCGNGRTVPNPVALAPIVSLRRWGEGAQSVEPIKRCDTPTTEPPELNGAGTQKMSSSVERGLGDEMSPRSFLPALVTLYEGTTALIKKAGGRQPLSKGATDILDMGFVARECLIRWLSSSSTLAPCLFCDSRILRRHTNEELWLRKVAFAP